MATKTWIEMSPKNGLIQKGSRKDEEGGSPQFSDLTESSLKDALKKTQRKKKVILEYILIFLLES